VIFDSGVGGLGKIGEEEGLDRRRGWGGGVEKEYE
jgi:hypothetical protein